MDTLFQQVVWALKKPQIITTISKLCSGCTSKIIQASKCRLQNQSKCPFNLLRFHSIEVTMPNAWFSGLELTTATGNFFFSELERIHCLAQGPCLSSRAIHPVLKAAGYDLLYRHFSCQQFKGERAMGQNSNQLLLGTCQGRYKWRVVSKEK